MFTLKAQNINLAKIKAKDLGVIRPDGTICFRTESVAKKYAKNRVIQSLKTESPFERAIMYKKNVVLAEFNGQADSMSISLSSEDAYNAVFVHSHTGGRFNPLSLPDFMAQILCNFREMIAYTAFGEFGSLKRMTKSLSKNRRLKLGKEVAEDGFYHLSKSFPEKQRLDAECIMQYRHSYPEFQDKIYAQFGQQIEKSCPVRLAMYNREAYRLSKEGVIGRALDEFFTNHAHEFGYKYFTNMPKD